MYIVMYWIKRIITIKASTKLLLRLVNVLKYRSIEVATIRLEFKNSRCLSSFTVTQLHSNLCIYSFYSHCWASSLFFLIFFSPIVAPNSYFVQRKIYSWLLYFFKSLKPPTNLRRWQFLLYYLLFIIIIIIMSPGTLCALISVQFVNKRMLVPSMRIRISLVQKFVFNFWFF